MLPLGTHPIVTWGRAESAKGGLPREDLAREDAMRRSAVADVRPYLVGVHRSLLHRRPPGGERGSRPDAFAARGSAMNGARSASETLSIGCIPIPPLRRCMLAPTVALLLPVDLLISRLP